MGNNPAPIRDVAPNVHSAVVIILQTQRQHTNSPTLILSHAFELGFVFGFFCFSVLMQGWWTRHGREQPLASLPAPQLSVLVLLY